MSVDERSRLQLAEAVKRMLGDDEGITLMELLPPVGWADVATKADLLHLERRFDELEGRFDVRFDELEQRIGLRFATVEREFDRALVASEHRLDARFERGFRSVIVTMMSLYITGFVATILAVALTR
jgi:hypothetical protein